MPAHKPKEDVSAAYGTLQDPPVAPAVTQLTLDDIPDYQPEHETRAGGDDDELDRDLFDDSDNTDE